jgi:gluconokinase
MGSSVIILMGVAGAGKTTVGRQLAQHLNWRFCDGDALHPQSNIDKMRHGIPLTDDDRRPWLARIHTALVEWIAHGERVVLACSLLKETYRGYVLNGHRDKVQLVYLKASPALLQLRLTRRPGHFMGRSLLGSQLEILEEPVDALVVEASQTPDMIIHTVCSTLVGQ